MEKKLVFLIRQEANKRVISVWAINDSNQCAVRCDATHRTSFVAKLSEDAEWGNNQLIFTIVFASISRKIIMSTKWNKLICIQFFFSTVNIFCYSPKGAHVRRDVFIDYLCVHIFFSQNPHVTLFLHMTGSFESKFLNTMRVCTDFTIDLIKYFSQFQKVNGYRLRAHISFKRTSSYLKYFLGDSCCFEVVYSENGCTGEKEKIERKKLIFCWTTNQMIW